MVHSNSLNIDDFIFEIDSSQNATFIKNISFQNQALEFIKKDTMITYQTVFEIDKSLLYKTMIILKNI